MAKVNEYPLFEQWYNTLNWILDKVEKMPKSTRYSINNRIANLAVDIIEMITEAIYTKQKKHILHNINLHLEKLRIFFRLCKDRRYISVKQYLYISTQLQEAGKMTGGWLKQCKE